MFNDKQDQLLISTLSQETGVIWFDQSGLLTASNPFFLDAIGDTHEKLLSSKFHLKDILNPFHKESGATPLRALLSGRQHKETFQLENRITHKKTWFEFKIYPLMQEAKVTQFLALATNIESRKQAEAIMKAQQVQIASEAKMLAMAEMAAGIGHEINNPLTIIHGRANRIKQLIESNQLDPKPLLDSIETITKTALRISKIILGLRSFTKEYENESISSMRFSEILNQTLDFCNEQINTQEIKLEIENTEPTLAIQCQPNQIKQALLELLRNAMQAAESSTEKWIKIAISDLGDLVQISISNSGESIPLKIRDKIFQPFFTTQPIGKGIGLGLCTAKGILEKHYGRIRLDTKALHPTFIVSIPKLQDVIIPQKAG